MDSPTGSTDATDPSSGDLSWMVRVDQLESVQRSVRAVVPSGIAVGCVTAAVAFYGAEGWLGPAGWFVLMILSNAYRGHVSRPGRSAVAGASPATPRDVDARFRRITLSSFLSGCVWALVPLFCDSTSPSETLFFMTIVCGVCAGSVIFSAAYAPVPIAFVTPALVAVTLWLVLAGGFHHDALAAMVFAYLCTLAYAARRGDRAVRAVSRIKNEALFMAADLRRSHAESTRATRELDFRANHDSLTGLLNREGFAKAAARFEAAGGGASTHAALLLDLDGFKAINDAFGHKTGDRVLKDVGVWLQQRLDRHDAVVGRWGGDEFAVLYHPRGADDAPEHVAQGLIDTIGDATSHYGGPLGVSVGICTSQDASTEEMLSFSDEALYEAKRRGRNRCHRFDEVLHGRLLRRRDIERDMVEAMASRDICAWYQPILADGGRRVHSLEAVLRWRHPKHGWVAPADVIFAAASTGLAERLMRHILEEICHGLVDLSAEGGMFADLPIAMNVSPREMSQLPVDVITAQVLAAHGIAPRRLQIEITEEVALDTSSARARLRALAESGVAVAIDDFGVGYSSLASLRGEYVHQVKIDRSFVFGIDSSPSSRLMVEAVVRLGREMDIEVVAEGVETREEFEMLASLDCPLLQGFYFMRPAPLAQVMAWSRRLDAATSET